MNDAAIIAKLRRLKHLEPRQDTVMSIKKRVQRSAGISGSTYENSIAVFAHIFTPVYGFGALLLVLFIISYHILTVNPMQRAVATVRMATKSIETAQTTDAVIGEEKNLDRAQKEIAALNLKGVPGKYTSEECRTVYIEFEEYMRLYRDKIQKLLSQHPGSLPRLGSISEKIHTYEVQAETRWPDMKSPF